jgi:hypothetical protein
MNVDIAFSGPAASVEALGRFLTRVEHLIPEPVVQPKVIVGDDRVIYVKAGFASDEEAWSAGEHAAELSAEIVEDTDVLVVLAPFVAASS